MALTIPLPYKQEAAPVGSVVMQHVWRPTEN
jgi:hypothetical protein